MSDPAPRRVIGGLAPVGGVPSALSRMKGAGSSAPAPTPAAAPVVAPAQPAQEAPSAPEAPPQATAAPERPSAAVSAPQRPQKAPARPRTRTEASPAAQRAAAPAEQAPKEKITTYIARPTRARAKAAFKATGHLEGDESFSTFVETAIERELARREKAYNDGKPYTGDGGRLAPGRPLQ